jgi:ribosome maturation factor RimP
MREEVTVGQAEDIRDLVAPAVADAGLELWDVEVARDVVRVLIDRPGGIDLESLAGVASQVVSPLLDEHPDLTPAGNFQLEVSSPGLERSLRTPDQYRRYIGTEITVKTVAPIAGARRHHGTLSSVQEHSIQLHPTDAPEGPPVELRLDQIDRARTVLTWGSASAPAGARGQAKASGAPRRAAAAKAASAPEEKDTAL